MTRPHQSPTADYGPSHVLPLELVYKIIDRYHANLYPSNLLSVALTCRALAHYTRSLVFARVIFECNPPRLARFQDLIASNPSLARAVRTVVLLGLKDVDVQEIMLLPWEQFENVRHVTFSAVKFDSMRSMFAILGRLQAVEEVHITYAKFKKYEESTEDLVPRNEVAVTESSSTELVLPQLAGLSISSPSSSPSSAQAPVHALNLKTVIVSGTQMNPRTFTSFLLSFTHPNPLALRTLLLDNVYSLPPPADMEYTGWTALLRIASASLENVALNVFAGRVLQDSNEPARASSATKTESYVAHLLAALAAASALRSLNILARRLDTPPPAADADPTGTLIVEALCAHLADTPHPALEHLTLGLVSCDTASPFSPTLCARLASVILGPTRTSDGHQRGARPCVRFKRLTVMLNARAGAAAAMSSWSTVEMARAKAAWLKRWEESFGRFSEEGVVVDVTA